MFFFLQWLFPVWLCMLSSHVEMNIFRLIPYCNMSCLSLGQPHWLRGSGVIWDDHVFLYAFHPGIITVWKLIWNIICSMAKPMTQFLWQSWPWFTPLPDYLLWQNEHFTSVSTNLSSQCHRLVYHRHHHVLSCPCDNARKRSLKEMHGNRIYIKFSVQENNSFSCLCLFVDCVYFVSENQRQYNWNWIAFEKPVWA